MKLQVTLRFTPWEISHTGVSRFHVCVRIRARLLVYAGIYEYIRVYVDVYVSLCAYIHVRIHICIRLCICTYILVRIYMCIRTYMYIHVCMCIYICVYQVIRLCIRMRLYVSLYVYTEVSLKSISCSDVKKDHLLVSQTLLQTVVVLSCPSAVRCAVPRLSLCVPVCGSTS